MYTCSDDLVGLLTHLEEKVLDTLFLMEDQGLLLDPIPMMGEIIAAIHDLEALNKKVYGLYGKVPIGGYQKQP